MKSCVDRFGNSLVNVGDEVENEFARFFAASTGSRNHGDNSLVHMDATKPFTLKDPAYAMASCIRQGNYSVTPSKLQFIEEGDYKFAAELVAEMYETVTGNKGEPLRGVLEDVQDRMAELEAFVVEVGQLKQNLWPMKDAEIAKWKDAYENMRDFAVKSGLDITCYGP